MAEKRLQIAVISGASHALKFKKENPYASDEEAIQHVAREMNSIISKVNSEDA